MTIPPQKSLHPFFSKSIRNALQDTTYSDITHLSDQSHPKPLDAPLNDENPILRGTLLKAENIPTIDTQPKKRGRKKKIVEAQVNGRDDDHEIQETKPSLGNQVLTSKEQQPALFVERLPDSKEDGFHDSKRRRLSPPEASGSWLEQLQQEAHPDRSVKYSVSPIQESQPESFQLGPCFEPFNPLRDVDTYVNAMPAGLDTTTDYRIPFDQTQGALPMPMMKTPPFVLVSEDKGISNKQLRLNGKGGFGSPNSTKKASRPGKETLPDLPEASKPIGRRRKRKHLIVIVRYGMDDREKRVIVGKRIEQIFSSPNGIMKGTGLQTEPSKPVVQASQSHRSTHPFFLGKVTPSIVEGQAKVAPAPDTTIQDSRTSASFKSFTTPGKLKLEASSRFEEKDMDDDKRYLQRAAKIFRLPGTVDPAWPFKGHIRIEPGAGKRSLSQDRGNRRRNPEQFHQRKEKSKVVRIEQDDGILLRFSETISTELSTSDDPKVRRPERLILSGHDIQLRIQNELHCRPSGDYTILHKTSPMHPGQSRPCYKADLSHPALCRMFDRISNAVGYFDKGDYETQNWIQKYAPQSAEDVLQVGKETSALRDWLASHTVSYVEGRAPQLISAAQAQKSKHAPGQERLQKRRKRPRRSDELDGFIVSSDEDTAELQALNDDGNAQMDDMPRSVIREPHSTSSKRGANAVLISGPHGCGKTAAAYAVAKQLGFEVFEIGSGSRRSGRDILDKVGDMTSNHQVRKADQKIDDPTAIDETLPTELEEQQSTLNSFFTAAKVHKKADKKPKKEKPKSVQQAESRIQRASRQKQSLILLEEVDVLYDEDKQFWETILELALQSKRPIILTCNDESLVPLNALSLHAIFRFNSPPKSIVEDYLVLMAAAEGHLINHDSASALYRSRKSDLRGSIMDLNFWCQMAVGDPRRGIDWFLARWPAGIDLDECGRKLRVVSNHTYRTNLNAIGSDSTASFESLNADEKLMLEGWREWEVEPWLASEQILRIPFTWESTCQDNMTSSDAYAFLAEFGRCLDFRSSADVFSTVDLPTMSQLREKIDPTQPPIPNKTLADFTQGYPVLQADVEVDFAQLDMQLMVATHLNIKRYFESLLPLYDTSFDSRDPIATIRGTALQKINDESRSELAIPSLKRIEFATAFDPIAETPSSANSNANVAYGALYSSSFDRPFSVVTEDLAPYVRSIVSFDLALEQQRHRLTNILSQTSDKGNGRSGKRIRTTRASRSALEGSSRSITRRERWFESKILNLDLVMRTAGSDWPRSVLPGIPTSEGGTSRASSIDPISM